MSEQQAQRTTARSRKARKSRAINAESCKGLRQVTYQVTRKLETGQYKTYEEVAKALSSEFVYGEGRSQQEKDERNMRRRAYDVMNVLAAVGHLSKSGKRLVYYGGSNDLTLFEMKKEMDRRMENIKSKWLMGQELC